MIDKQLLDYVHDQLVAGTTEEAVTKILVSKGWNAQDVRDAFLTLKSQSGKKSSFNTRTALTLVISITFLSAIGAAGYYFFIKDSVAGPNNMSGLQEAVMNADPMSSVDSVNTILIAQSKTVSQIGEKVTITWSWSPEDFSMCNIIANNEVISSGDQRYNTNDSFDTAFNEAGTYKIFSGCKDKNDQLAFSEPIIHTVLDSTYQATRADNLASVSLTQSKATTTPDEQFTLTWESSSTETCRTTEIAGSVPGGREIVPESAGRNGSKLVSFSELGEHRLVTMCRYGVETGSAGIVSSEVLKHYVERGP